MKNFRTMVIATIIATMAIPVAFATGQPDIEISSENSTQQSVVFNGIPSDTKNMQATINLSENQDYSFLANSALNSLIGVEFYTKTTENSVTIYLTSNIDTITKDGNINLGVISAQEPFNIIGASNVKVTNDSSTSNEWEDITKPTTPEDNNSDSNNSGSNSSSSSSSSNSTDNKTETVTNPDGSKTTTVTNSDGSKTATTEFKNGSKTVTQTSKDGTVKTQISLSDTAVNNAIQKNEPVSLPINSLNITTNKSNAQTITVKLPSGTSSAKVQVPISNVTAGTVAVLVNADGSEQIIKTSVATDNGIKFNISNGATVKIIDNSKSFSDVPSNYWGAESIAFASSRELFNGVSENSFAPASDMNRAMIVTVLARLEGVDTNSGTTWYEQGTEWAKQNGISDGTNLTSSVSREQLATMLYRYAGSPKTTDNVQNFTDSSSISSWASDAMNWAVETGLIGGMGDGTISPKGNATRAQITTILMRYIENIA